MDADQNLSRQNLSRRTFVGAAAATAVALSLPTISQAMQAAGTIDVGAISDIKDGVIDNFAKEKKILLIKTGGKIYATSSQCTHKNCVLKPKEGVLACGCHNSSFTLEGKPTKGPAKLPLNRYGISVDSNNHVIVDKSKEFPQSKWNDEGAFITA